MFETLDTMISLGVIFLILSMVNKYLISLVKRIFRTKAKVITKEMETFIGEKTSKYMLPWLEKKAKHLNFLDGKKQLRLMNKEQLKTVVGELEKFMKSENAEEFKNVFGIDISVDDIKKEVQGELDEIKAHLNSLKDKVESMYDNTMEKISEVYETKIRYRALYFGIALAFFINADFFGIYNSLSNNSLVREELIAQSGVIKTQMEQFSNQIELDENIKITNIENEIKDVNANVSNLTDKLSNAGLQLGWTENAFSAVFCHGVGPVVYKLIGLLLAGLLISFGAPFWHDFIGTFTGLRKILQGRKVNSGKNNTSLPPNPLVQ